MINGLYMQDDKIIHCYLKVHKRLACEKNANISVELQREDIAI
ncbi:hypothetical protein [Ehrlichia ruminantium]|nr:hypothetical protein [Ehrlichia ruminantium]